MANFFRAVVEENGLQNGIYVEPYAGGASVGLALLLSGYVGKIVINDIDPHVHAFWHSVLYRTDDFCRLIEKTPVTLSSWREQWEIYRAPSRYGQLRKGFAFFYLNRTNRSGILNGGVIGGLRQKGKWKVDARFNKQALIERIQRIALHRRQISLHNMDAVELIRELKKKLPRKTLIYFDPPYYVKGKDLYLNFFEHSDHERIVAEIKTLRHLRWIVTYDNVKPIRRLYRGYAATRYHLNYSAASVSKGQEVLYSSPGLIVPKTLITSSFRIGSQP